jgi:arabinogalactan oligomer/maltooligosaccharide transport system permease protein
MPCAALRPRLALAALLAFLVVLLRGPVPATPPAAQAQAQAGARVVVWHAYRGDELAALTEVIRLAERELPGLRVDTLAVPFDAYASKLESAIPHGHGPDVFIDAHERLPSYLARGLVAPLGDALAPAADAPPGWEPLAVEALSREGQPYAFPLAVKCLALYVNPALTPDAPATLEQIEALRGRLPRDIYPLVYYAQNAYFHAPLAHAYGSGLLDVRTGEYTFVGDAAARSVERVAAMVRARVVPEEVDGSLVSQLFANGRAATAISGPWLAAELRDRVRYTVVPLPRVESTGRAMEPFATIEGAFVSARAHDRDAALRFARFLAGPRAAVIRARIGRQVVASVEAWSDPALASDAFLRTFRDAARQARPMPTHPHMRLAFEPANQSLRKALRGDVPIREALEQGLHRFRDATRPLPAPRNPVYAMLALGVFALWACFAAVRRARDPDFRRELARSLPAYRYVLHAVVALLALVVLPLVVGAATSLGAGREGQLYYVGLANYWDILTARGASLFASGSFYVVLGVTVLWTVANISLHLLLGVALALLLSRPALKLKGLYRVLLIIPWAVPSYVTALAWKGMFHRQLGAINAVITALGGEPVAWFSRFSTAFTANVMTNVWLGFPFMMVVTIGALTAIPKDLYEAAAVDGASAWQRFRSITLPLLKPSLAPAVAMGAVWTFNMFNVIYLVSGGEPDGQTEILVTEAYRWAFTRQAQHGYAAAYAVLIFGILLVGTRLLDRAAKRVSGP